MLFYFSGTGNTRWAAETLARATGEQLLFIPEEQQGRCEYALAEGERIGFVFPTHGWQPPRIVRNFIKKMHIDHAEGHYCYALTTCGDSIGVTMDILNGDLRKAGLPEASSLFSLVMPESYVCLPFMYTDTPEKEQRKLAVAAEQLKAYAELIVNKKEGEVHIRKGPLPWVMSHIVGSYFNGKMVTDKKFTVDSEACIHCGRCVSACPTGAVTFFEEQTSEDLHNNAFTHSHNFDGLPVWHHDGSCTCCLACYHHCPKHAINYGKITRRRGQYYFGHTLSN